MISFSIILYSAIILLIVFDFFIHIILSIVYVIIAILITILTISGINKNGSILSSGFILLLSAIFQFIAIN